MNRRERCALGLRRELVLVCDRDGTIRWLDGVAERFLKEGAALASYALPGLEGRVGALLEHAARGRVEAWEMTLVLDGAPKTLTFAAEACDDEIVLAGSLLTDAQMNAVSAMAAATNEVAALQREAAAQKLVLEDKNGELTRTLAELADSNRGLVALHAEIDEKNDSLIRSVDVKSRVIASVSHEFRTPINSILGITQLLLDRLDGELTAEQEKQLRFVRTSAESLSELVNDLLDLSRIEAGKYQLRASKFVANDVLGSLRGMMRPLVPSDAVELDIQDAPADVPAFDTDKGKVAQILRNLIANALKFTQKGHVRVCARAIDDGHVVFTVEDTGIGIKPEDQQRIFEEFVQIDGPVQRTVRGTGLGLALSRKLAEILGGSLTVQSRVGEGSVFTLKLPTVHEEVQEMAAIEEKATEIDPNRTQVLVIEDDRQTMFMYERYLSSSGFQVLPARTVDDAKAILKRTVPAAIVLDVMLEGETTWRLVEDIKEDPRTRDVPLMVVTVVDRSQKARALGADEFWLKPVNGERLIRKLNELARRGPMTKVLVIDDDDASRYLVRRLLEGTDYRVIETGDAAEGVRLARREEPHVILLDFLLAGATAFDVIDDLKVDARTRAIPIIIQTSKKLDTAELERLQKETTAVLQKHSLSRELAISRIRDALAGAGINPGPRSKA